uniref:Uncharacterized protein n=1 Tax=viral metagenome TaxID=1070528 RepID=A0A6H1ZIR3_9ZZZZ
MVEQKVICKICNKEMKRITVAHISTHGLKSMNEYETYGEQLTEDLENIAEPVVKELEEEKVTMTYKERMEYLFKDKEKDPDRPFSQFLKENGVTEMELLGMIDKYKVGRELNVSEQIQRNIEQGKKEADKYKNKDEVEVTDVNIAESLEKNHGFTCIAVKSSPRKTWVLTKNK